MPVEVDFKLRQSFSRAVLGSSLAGDGLLVRLRSTSIALLAVVAAIGLGLVAFISQMGWPAVFSGPIPAGPELGAVRNDPIVAPRAPARPGFHALHPVRGAAATGARGTPAAAPTADPNLGLTLAHQTQPAPVESTPAPPTSPSPEPVTQPVTSPQPTAVVVTAPSGTAGPSPSQPSTSGTSESKDDKDKEKSGSRRSRTPRTVPPPSTEDKDKEGKDDLEDDQDWDESQGSDAEDRDWSGGSNGRWSGRDDRRRGGWSRD